MESLSRVDTANGVGHHTHLVAVADECGEQRVGEVFDKLARVERHAVDRRGDGGIDVSQHIGRAVVAHTEHDAVGMHEVIPAMSLTQELGVVGHAEVLSHFQSSGFDMRDNLRRRCRRGHRRLDDEHLVFILRSDGECLVDGFKQIGQVSLAVLAVWRTHTVVYAVALYHRLS